MKKIILIQETPIAKGATLLMGRVWTVYTEYVSEIYSKLHN